MTLTGCPPRASKSVTANNQQPPYGVAGVLRQFPGVLPQGEAYRLIDSFQ